MTQLGPRLAEAPSAQKGRSPVRGEGARKDSWQRRSTSSSSLKRIPRGQSVNLLPHRARDGLKRR